MAFGFANRPGAWHRTGPLGRLPAMRNLLVVVGLLAGCKDGVEVVLSDAQTRDALAEDVAVLPVVDARVGDTGGGDARVADAAPPVDARIPDPVDAALADGAVVDAAVDAAVEVDAQAPAPDAGAGPVADPGQPGPFEVQEAALEIPVAAPRRLAAQVFRPAGAEARPLVLFMHGFQLTGAGYASTGRHLASHGFVVVLPTMGDSLFAPLTHRQLADDVSAMLDFLLMQPGIDPERVGAAGHSRGGKQVIFAAALDDRIDAVFGVDPVDAGPPFGGNPQDYPSVTPELMGDVDIPSAFLGAGLGGMAAFPGAPACAPVADNHQAYFEAAPGPAWSYTLAQAGHLDFLDDCGLLCLTCTQGADPAGARAFTRQTLAAFFKWQLEGDLAYQPWVEGPPVTATPGVAFERR